MKIHKNIFTCIVLFTMLISTNFLHLQLNADTINYVNVPNLNLRINWNHKSTIIKVLSKWEILSISETLNNGWKKVITDNWTIWYVNWKFLSEIEPYYEKTQWSIYEVDVNSAFVRWDNFKKIQAVLRLWDKLEVLDEKIIKWIWIKVRIIESKYTQSYVWREWYISKKIVKPIEEIELNSAWEPETDLNSAWLETQADLDSAWGESQIDLNNTWGEPQIINNIDLLNLISD